MKDMEILFPGIARKRRPDRAPEIGTPVRGQLVLPGIHDIEIFPVLSLGIAASLPEPEMLRTAVIYDQIQDHIHAPLPRLPEEFLHLGICPEDRIDLVIIADIIALVDKRRLITGANPQNIHPQILQIIQLFYDSAQISDPVSIGIHKTLGIDLINNLVVPPFSGPDVCVVSLHHILLKESFYKRFFFCLSLHFLSAMIYYHQNF